VRKRVFTATILSALLFLAVSGTLFVAVGNFSSLPPTDSFLSVTSPQKNRTYITSTVPVSFRISTWRNALKVEINVLYSLDGQPNESMGGVALKSVKQLFENSISKFYYFTGNLTDVPDGTHSVTIGAQWNTTYSEGTKPVPSEQVSLPIYFSVSTSVVFPNVTVFSLQPLDSSDVVVRFMIDKPVQSIGYSLDGENRVNFDAGILVEYSYGSRAFCRGNLTLTELPAGLHSLTIYATDLAGVTGNATVAFAVAEEAVEQPPPLPAALIASASDSVIAVGVLARILFYSKRNKRKLNPLQAS